MVIKMEKKMFGPKSRFGSPKQRMLKMLKLNANLAATIKRVTETLLPTSRDSIPLDMLASNCLPYQASKTYRTIMTEYDCRRAQTMVEVQRSLRRL